VFAASSYPIVEKEAISNSLAVAFNWIAFAVAVLVVELGVFWRQHSMTVALAGILHQAWCCASEAGILSDACSITLAALQCL
jgi:hypothetical protein